MNKKFKLPGVSLYILAIFFTYNSHFLFIMHVSRQEIYIVMLFICFLFLFSNIRLLIDLAFKLRATQPHLQTYFTSSVSKTTYLCSYTI